MVELLLEHKLDLLNAAAYFLAGASIIAKLTPTPKDDKILDKLYGLVHLFGLTKKEK